MAVVMPVWRDAHAGLRKPDTQRETLEKIPCPLQNTLALIRESIQQAIN